MTRRRLSPAGKDAEASMEERESDQEGKKKLKKKSVKVMSLPEVNKL